MFILVISDFLIDLFLGQLQGFLEGFGTVRPIVSTLATVETEMQAPAHLICCINHSDVVTYIVSFLRVLAEHAHVWTEILGNVGVQLHVSSMSYEAHSLWVWMAGIPAVTIRFSGTVSGIGWISGLVILPQLLQHVYWALLFLVLHMRYQVLRLVS